MTVHLVSANGVAWSYAPDEPAPRVAERSQAMLYARLFDEVLATPPNVPLRATTSTLGAMARYAGGGRVGVVGRPHQAFFAPDIALSQIDLEVEGEGFLPLRLDATVGPQPGYPDAYTAVDAGALSLHRRPTRVAGRVMSRATGPLAGASVTLTGIWPVLQSPAGPASPANGMPARAGLYANRPAGSTLRRRNLALAAQVKSLERPAIAGENRVRLSDRQAIAVGQILAIEPGDMDRVEYVGIAAIDTASTPDQPSEVTLDFPLRRDHPEGVQAARAVAGASGAANLVARDARAGDVTVWTGGLGGIGPATTAIEISGGGQPSEYHASQLYAAQTGPGGDFVLPPIHRIAMIRLRVTHPAQPQPVSRSIMLAWNTPRQIEDFIFP